MPNFLSQRIDINQSNDDREAFSLTSGPETFSNLNFEMAEMKIRVLVN